MVDCLVLLPYFRGHGNGKMSYKMRTDPRSVSKKAV